MKRVKVMLTAIGIFAIVGGALAFKAKTVGSEDYCIRAFGSSNICTTFVTDAQFLSTGMTTRQKYTTVTQGTATCDDSGNDDCTIEGRLEE